MNESEIRYARAVSETVTAQTDSFQTVLWVFRKSNVVRLACPQASGIPSSKQRLSLPLRWWALQLQVHECLSRWWASPPEERGFSWHSKTRNGVNLTLLTPGNNSVVGGFEAERLLGVHRSDPKSPGPGLSPPSAASGPLLAWASCDPFLPILSSKPGNS